MKEAKGYFCSVFPVDPQKRSLRLSLYSVLAHLAPNFVNEMTTYYCYTLEEALRRAKAAGKKPGCHFSGIILKSGKRVFAIYKEGKVIEQYSVIVR